ncbi:MAG TPA: protein kinase [Nannocystaceae bacterium]|nr:protein kinase [Nannocystaceae bacterium]
MAASRYTLVQRIARGGMGDVHLAVVTGHRDARKLVVVKQLLESLADDPDFDEMFTNEARLAATLDHPHIVRVYDVCEIDGRSSLVMEYVHGESLGRLLQLATRAPGRFGRCEALTIVDAVAGALAYAHTASTIDGRPLHIVHRDVSPNNILVGRLGEVKLIDFGIARALSATRVTRDDVVKGKSAYMAPEQFTGGDADERTDIFALGIVLYEATTLHRAFKADNEPATINRIVSGDLVRPTQIVADYPARLEDIVLTALAPDPRARFASAAAMRDALSEVADELGIRYSSARVGELVVALAGERPLPRVDAKHYAMLRARRFATARGPIVAFGAGVLATAAVVLATPSSPVEPAAQPESTAIAAGTCGDGVPDRGEDCDDGNTKNGDGCNRDCRRSGATVWERTHQGEDPGRTRDDRGYRVAIAEHDAIVVVGEAAVARAGQNIFVRKYDADGGVAWTKQPGKEGDDEAWAVAVTADGGVIVGGYVAKPDTGRDFWLAAFDADGRERWQYEADAIALAGGTQGKSDDEIRELSFAAPDRIVVVGKRLVDGAEDRFAAHGRVDARGLELVSWRLDAAEQKDGWDALSGIGRVGTQWVVSGTRTLHDPLGAKSMWLGWFDDDGQPVRELAIDPPGWPRPAGGEARRVRVIDDVVYLAGSLGGYDTEADAWYGAFDREGHALWSRTYDSPKGTRDFAHSIAVDREGNVIVVGESGGVPGERGELSAQAWITKLAPDLTELWSESYNGPENERDVAFDVATDSTDHIVVVGYQSVAGNDLDLWVRKYRP